MRIFLRARPFVAAAGVATLLLTPLPAHAAESGEIALVDVAPDGTPGNGGVGGSDVSDDGRYIAFASTSDNLVPGDVNGTTDIFVRDTQTATTTLVSGGLGGQPANDSAEYVAAISGNGRYVAFTSNASNLVQDDTNNERDVFVYDRQTGVTTRASVFAGARQIQGISSGATISDNGRYVAFVVTAFNGMDDQGLLLYGQAAFVHDMRTGATTRVSLQADGGTNLSVFQAAISGNGTRVAFSGSGDWIGDGGTHTGIFVHDLSSGVTIRANLPVTGDMLPDGTNPSISKDGTMVSWESYDPYVPADTNGMGDVYVRDHPGHRQPQGYGRRQQLQHLRPPCGRRPLRGVLLVGLESRGARRQRQCQRRVRAGPQHRQDDRRQRHPHRRVRQRLQLRRSHLGQRQPRRLPIQRNGPGCRPGRWPATSIRAMPA
jgi:hypothetical protein